MKDSAIRIFISSPSDVKEERNKARQVIDQLQRVYGQRVQLIPVLWEDLPLGAEASFQEGIDLVLSEKHRIDIAVFIMWSRLGSPVGGLTRKSDGTTYRSGTEREFDLMLKAREQSGGKHPHLLAYVRRDESGFRSRLLRLPKSDLSETIEQQFLADSFIEENFCDAEGRNLRAYHTFAEPVSFARRLRVHLHSLITEMLETCETRDTAWLNQSPYRGLEVFDLEHAPIFFGREEEVCEVETILQRRWTETGTASAMVIGSSGSGKSSLARAGVAHSLIHQNLDTTVREWRHSIIMPRDAYESWGNTLAKALSREGALPELGDSGVSLDSLGEAINSNPETAWNLIIAPAFTRASGIAGGTVRLLLILDQFEEFYAGDQRFGDSQRRAFLGAVVFLARTGHVWVLGTLRSDFYGAAQQDPEFLELKGQTGAEGHPSLSGQIDLLPPGPMALYSLIERPAQLAGVKFEKDETTGRSLSDVIVEDALEAGVSLPLLEYALEELYRRRDESLWLMRFADYEALGGVKGALVSRAESEIEAVKPAVRNVFSEVIQELITLGISGNSEKLSRRPALYELIANTPEKKELVDRFVTARLLTADKDEKGRSVVVLAHDALLWEWRRIADAIRERFEFLRFRARFEEAVVRWQEAGENRELLTRDKEILRRADSEMRKGRLRLQPSQARFLAESQRMWIFGTRWTTTIWVLVTSGLLALSILVVQVVLDARATTLGLLVLMLPLGWATINRWLPSPPGKRLLRYCLFYLGLAGFIFWIVIDSRPPNLPNQGEDWKWINAVGHLFLSSLTLGVSWWFWHRRKQYPREYLKLRLPRIRPRWQSAAILGLISLTVLVPVAMMGFHGHPAMQSLRTALLPFLAPDQAWSAKLTEIQNLDTEARRYLSFNDKPQAREILNQMIKQVMDDDADQNTVVANLAWTIGDMALAADFFGRAKDLSLKYFNYWKTQPNSEKMQVRWALNTLSNWLLQSSSIHMQGIHDAGDEEFRKAINFIEREKVVNPKDWLKYVRNNKEALGNDFWNVPGKQAMSYRQYEIIVEIWRNNLGDLLKADPTALTTGEEALLQEYFFCIRYVTIFRMKEFRYDEAHEAISEVLRIRPGNLGARVFLGAIYLLQGKNDDAEQTFFGEKPPGPGTGGEAVLARKWREEVENVVGLLTGTYQINHPRFQEIIEKLRWEEEKALSQ